MENQIVITAYKNQYLIAVYASDVLQELSFEPKEAHIHIGDIYIGKVKNIVPNIQAAFVEFVPGIIGYYSLKDNTSHYFCQPKKNDKLVAGDEILVQVDRENLKTKGYTLTGHLNLANRFAVMKTGKSGIQISSKIKSEDERKRLMTIVTDANENINMNIDADMDVSVDAYAWTVRTAAANQTAEQIQKDMSATLVDYNKVMSTYKCRTCFSKIYSGEDFTGRLIKRYNEQSHLVVTTDCIEIYENIRSRFSGDLSEKVFELRLYDDPSYALIKLKNLEAQIEKALARKVWMNSGAYLVIEPTEALTVIDVNTGKAIGKQDSEDNFFKINMEAAKEVCRQLRLRNISGIVIVDFINMKDEAHLSELFRFLRQEAVKDPVQTSIVDRTALHLVEITRKKTKKTLFEQWRSIST